MMILYALGLLAVCYLLFAEAGLAAFWMIIKWPLVIGSGLLALVLPESEYETVFIVSLILSLIPLDYIPEWFWQLGNAAIWIGIMFGGMFFMGVFN